LTQMLDLGRAEEYCGSSWWVATALDTRPHAGRTAMGGGSGRHGI